MNSIPQIQIPAPESQQPKSQTEAPPAEKRCKTKRARNGKVARLPDELRNSICLMMQDGLTSRDILEKLGPNAKGLRQRNLSEWKRGGFLDWKHENKWEAELKAQQQFALQLLLTNDDTKLPHVVLQIAATQVFQALRKVVPDNFTGKFDADASDYTRLLNSLARISRSSLVFTKYSHLCEKEKAAELKQLDPTRPPSQAQSAALMKLWNDFFLGPDYDPMAHPLHDPQPVASNPAKGLSDQENRANTDPNQPSALPLSKGEGEQGARTS